MKTICFNDFTLLQAPGFIWDLVKITKLVKTTAPQHFQLISEPRASHKELIQIINFESFKAYLAPRLIFNQIKGCMRSPDHSKAFSAYFEPRDSHEKLYRSPISIDFNWFRISGFTTQKLIPRIIFKEFKFFEASGSTQEFIKINAKYFSKLWAFCRWGRR